MNTLQNLYEQCIDRVSLEKLLNLSKTSMKTSTKMIYFLNHTIGSVVGCKIKNADVTLWALYESDTWDMEDEVSFTSKADKVDQTYNTIIHIS